MDYKCPLCLKELTEGDQLERFCSCHPEHTQKFDCSSYAIQMEMFCPQAECECNQDIESGVVLRHVNCDAKNPFWAANQQRLDIPGDARSKKISGQVGGTTVDVVHWEIGMLRRVPNAEEMWFPLMLLRATAETQARKRVGVLIELAGATGAGKTILAMQAMDYQGYVAPWSGDRHVEVRDYIFSRRPAGASDNPLITTLYLRHLMERNRQGIFLPAGTKKETGDLKVVFLKPTRTPEMPSPKNEKRSSFFSQIKNEGKNLFKDILDSEISRSFWYTVAFYDTAGEWHEEEHGLLDTIESSVDKVTILLDATEFADSTGEQPSIEVAAQRIQRLGARQKLRCCCVVSKLDSLMEGWSANETNKVISIAEDLTSDERNDAAARALLVGWLKQHPTTNKGVLAKYIETNQIPIFFVWTEGLPGQPTGARVFEQPYSPGLARFICWCLDIKWEDISQVDGS